MIGNGGRQPSNRRVGNGAQEPHSPSVAVASRGLKCLNRSVAVLQEFQLYDRSAGKQPANRRVGVGGKKRSI